MNPVVVRVADAADIGSIASLRSLWSAGAGEDPDFETRMAAWLAVEGDRRTTWLATLGDSPVGVASVFEYRRMPRPIGAVLPTGRLHRSRRHGGR